MRCTVQCHMSVFGMQAQPRRPKDKARGRGSGGSTTASASAGLGLLVASRRFSSIKECHKTLRKISEKTLSTKMKLQLFCVAAAALIQSAFVASHEVPSFRGVSLLDDAKDAAAVSLYLLGSICPRPTLTACYETLVHRSLPSSPPRPMLPKRKTSSLTRPRRRGKLRIYSWSLLLCTGS